jgi:Fuc2NAc and GlcNAc transferase
MKSILEIIFREPLGVVLIVFVMTLFTVKFYIKLASNYGVLDIPNSRSSHTTATVRGGGLVVALMWLVVLLLFSIVSEPVGKFAMGVAPAAFCVAFVGWLDDLKGLSARIRLAAHIGIACFFLIVLTKTDAVGFAWDPLSIGWVGYLGAIFGIVWSINSFNFMDGTDGLASVQALFLFGVGGWILNRHGAGELGLCAWIRCGSILGFLYWNWPKAKVFMGDVCSGFLGLLVAAFTLYAARVAKVSLIVWIILYSVFWFDASMTVMRRIYRQEDWLSAHRSHAYQRLYHLAGWSHFQILKGAMFLNIFLAILAIAADFYSEFEALALGLTLVCLSCVFILVERIAPMPFIETKSR